jgi:hypothetical protein
MITQGTLLDISTDVAVDDRPINQGLVAANSQCKLWGGMAVTAFNQDPCGALLQLAPNLAAITAFTTFDRSTALVSSAQAPVPSASRNMSINFVTLGCGLRLVLRADEALVAGLRDALASTPVSWDFERQCAIPYSSAAGQLPVRGLVRVVTPAWVVVGSRRGAYWDPNGTALIVQL